MTIHLIVLIDRRAPQVTSDLLMQKLAANPGDLAPVVEHYRSWWRVQEWERPSQVDTGRDQLLGPGGFSIHFESHSVQIHHVVPFAHFARNVDDREELRRAWRWFAQQFGSPRAIYTHELMPYSGVDLVSMEAGLRSTTGPPARDFVELASAEAFGPRAWYIDDFANLDGPRA